MKLVKKAVIAMLLLVFAISMIGCSKKESIVGSWEGTESGVTATFTFNEDGTGSVGMEGMTLDLKYTLDGKKISMTMSLMGIEQTTSGTWSIDGDTLTLTTDDGGESTLTRKK